MPQSTEGNFGVIHHGIRGYNGPTYSSGWSFNVPTDEFHKAFKSGDKRRDASILDIVKWAEDNNAITMKVMSIRDILIINIFQDKVIQKIQWS